ncbi:MAG TPA: hypothetical protein VJ063_09495, partial [Verrucomicrobiae bacterium]|nr:hypothetical protein [Verrucomicrobiae bacterium]
LVGEGRAGICALLASPAADATIADADALDSASDEALLAPDLFVPGMRRLPLDSMTTLVAPKPVRLEKNGHLTASVVADWIANLKVN